MRRALLLLGLFFVSTLLGLGALLWSWSPGTPRPIVDALGRPAPGSLSEKSWVEINGVRQGMFIESVDPRNPVLLFVHGGPGMPEYFLREARPTGLEEDFTICWWEQRGAGLSFDPESPLEELTEEQLVLDTIAVSRYLRERFGQEKIYLLGHSWGSFLAIQAAARAPELYFAYIGMAQVTDQRRSEVEAHRYVLAQYAARGDAKMVHRLEAAAPPAEGPLPAEWMSMRDEVMHALGVGTTHDMRSVVTGIFVPVWKTRAYTVSEKLNLWRGKLSSRARLWDDLLATDLARAVPALEVPAYFAHGVHDYTVSLPQAKAYFAVLRAPMKAFYDFEHSAHSPLFEEPEKMRRILREDVPLGRVP